MEKRAFGRVSTNVMIDFYYGNELLEGTVTNLSKNGLYIEADTCPSRESDIEVILILGDEAFRLPGKVKRTLNNNGLCGGMGIELSDPSQSYSEFVSNIMAYCYQKML
jgi:hypothetical protein